MTKNDLIKYKVILKKNETDDIHQTVCQQV